ncbi:MAG TPA: alpha/beta fold hydrolase [bacterium]|nr:alpha/beta fold hydrolase [bacterium]
MPRDPRTWPLARPDLDGFSRPGSRPGRALLLHGFTATPREVLPLADALSARGFPVTAIRLPGHGTDVADLERTGSADWIGAAEAALLDAAAAGPVFVAGQSMGGLLALILAARHPARVRGVASLAAPLWFASRNARVLTPFFRWTQFWRLVRYVPKGVSDLPPERLSLHFTYDRFPVRAVMALDEVIREASRGLPAITSPLLVIQGALDRSAPPAGARVLFERAGTAQKEFVEMKSSHHLLTLDVENDAVCARVVDFFARLEAGAVAATAGAGNG